MNLPQRLMGKRTTNLQLITPIPMLQWDPIFAHGAARSQAKLCSSLHPSKLEEHPDLKEPGMGIAGGTTLPMA